MDFEERKGVLNIGFDYSEKNIEIIKNLNERIFNYYHIVYEEMLRLYENLISLKGISTDTFCIEAGVWCLYDKLSDLSEENTETISLQDLVQLKTNKLTHQFKIVMEKV